MFIWVAEQRISHVIGKTARYRILSMLKANPALWLIFLFWTTYPTVSAMMISIPRKSLSGRVPIGMILKRILQQAFAHVSPVTYT